MKVFASTGDSGFPILDPSICLCRRLLKVNTVFLVTEYSFNEGFGTKHTQLVSCVDFVNYVVDCLTQRDVCEKRRDINCHLSC